MNVPGFNAEASLYGSINYLGHDHVGVPDANAVIPAIPFCGNCDQILETCEKNGWRPQAVCNACAVGNCYSGVEVPPGSLDSWGSRW